MSNVSAVVLVKNEQPNIERCLKSIEWCNELIIIDDYSSDKIYRILKKFSVKTYKHHLKNDFSQQRNFALAKANSEWVLFVDADEVVSKSLQNQIERAISSTTAIGFKIRRVDTWMGRELKMSDWGETYILRLARKNKGKWKRRVHEYWDIKGTVNKIDEPLLHYPHPTVSSFVKHIGIYSNMHAIENIREGKKGSVFHVFIFPVGKFLKSYIWDRGYKDGIPGLIYSVMLSFHSFLAWGTIWLQKNK